ncbi:pimeloyl-ACP methyl ester carboxylesterase [Bradyrhizobium sp. F1.13.1]
MQQKTIATDILDIAYREYGAPDGWPCIMGHGFPYDVNAYAETAPIIAQAGARVLVPWLRGYGPTRFRSAATLRSGEQAALGADLLAFMDALGISRAVVGGYDWGGRAACVVSVLHPERVIALVSGNSYNIQNIARSMEPASPPEEAALWYQYLFHNERGRRALERNRRGFARQLWSMWSPTWAFDDATFETSAMSFDNPDFVDVVIHSYRHRYALVAGDPAYAAIEAKLATPSRRSGCRPSRSMATATASIPARRTMQANSRAFSSGASLQGPATICRRSGRPNGRRPCSMCGKRPHRAGFLVPTVLPLSQLPIFPDPGNLFQSQPSKLWGRFLYAVRCRGGFR